MKKIEYPKTGLFRKENLDRIQFKNLLWLEGVRFSFPASDSVEIRLAFRAKDRDSGKKTRFYTTGTFRRNLFHSTKQIANKVRWMAKFYVTHEIDECFHFDNKRIYDPHRNRVYRNGKRVN